MTSVGSVESFARRGALAGLAHAVGHRLASFGQPVLSREEALSFARWWRAAPTHGH